MTVVADRDQIGRRRPLAAAWEQLRVARWLPLLAVFAAAVSLRLVLVANTDVSWLITLCEKVLDGQRLYIDLIELNPPASVFLYLPLVALARVLALRPEVVVDAGVFVAIGVSLALAGHILGKARRLEGIDTMRLAVLVAAMLAILPAQTFGEREHFAVIFLLPLFALWTSRLAGAEQRLSPVLAAGLGAGLALTLKPQFALGVAPAFIALLVYARSWRPIFAPENWIAAAVATIYGASVVVFYPTFISDITPMVMATYVPIRHSLFVLLVQCPVLLFGAMQLRLAAFWRPGLLHLPAVVMFCAAACGFFLVFLLQGKGWPYHGYPALAFVYLVLAVALSSRDPPRPRPHKEKAALAFGMAAIACATFYWLNLANSVTMLNEPIRRLAANPRLAMISSDVSVGHPLVRQVGGTWVGRVGSLWVTAGVVRRRRNEVLDADTVKRLAAYAERDRVALVEDIRQDRPDIIVIDRTAFDWEVWARSDPALAEQLAAYRTAASLDGHVILHRRD
jgi:hypothetical protein